jgi:hypothetical protein
MLPSLFDHHRIILRDSGEGEFDEKAQAPDQFIFVSNSGCPFVVAHPCSPRKRCRSIDLSIAHRNLKCRRSWAGLLGPRGRIAGRGGNKACARA